MLPKKKVTSMPYVVFLHPQSLAPQKQNTTKEEEKDFFFFNEKLKNCCKGSREWDTSGLHQSISLKGGWELASSQ